MKKLLCFLFIGSTGLACSKDADEASRAQSTQTQKSVVQEDTDVDTSVDVTSVDATSVDATSVDATSVDSGDLDSELSASADQFAKRIVSINATAAASGSVTPKELNFDEKVQAALQEAFLDQQRKDPSVMTEEQASAIAAKLYDVMNVAKQNNSIKTSRAIVEFTTFLAQVQKSKPTSLALYDNSTAIGRILNAGNGVIDLVVELYAAVLNADLQAVTRVSSSAARVLFQLFES